MESLEENSRTLASTNCASISCPALLDRAYNATDLEEQLNSATRNFLNDTSNNNLDPERPKLSPIFKWYKPDFTQNQTLYEFINQFIDTPIKSAAKRSYTDYNWNLNDVQE